MIANGPVTQLVYEVIANLGEQTRAYQTLLELSRQQLEALRTKNVRAVHDVLQEIEIAMVDRGRAELRREMVLNQLATQLGVPAHEITSPLLQTMVEEPIGQQLDHAAAGLRAIVEELNGIVSGNRALLEHELTVVETIVEGMTTDTGAQKMYAGNGLKAEAPRIQLLDAQV